MQWVQGYVAEWATSAFRDYWRTHVTSAISAWLTEHVWLEIALLFVVILVALFCVCTVCSCLQQHIQHQAHMHKQQSYLNPQTTWPRVPPVSSGVGNPSVESKGESGGDDDFDPAAEAAPPVGPSRRWRRSVSVSSLLFQAASIASIAVMVYRFLPASVRESPVGKAVDEVISKVAGPPSASYGSLELVDFKGHEYMDHDHRYRHKAKAGALEGWTIASCTDMRIDTGPVWIAFHPTRITTVEETEAADAHSDIHTGWTTTHPHIALPHAQVATPFTILDPEYERSLGHWSQGTAHEGVVYHYTPTPNHGAHHRGGHRMHTHASNRGVSTTTSNARSSHTEVVTPNPGVRPMHFRHVVWSSLNVLDEALSTGISSAHARIWTKPDVQEEMKGYGFSCDKGELRLDGHQHHEGRGFAFNALEHVLFQVEADTAGIAFPHTTRIPMIACGLGPTASGFTIQSSMQCMQRAEIPQRVLDFFVDVATHRRDLLSVYGEAFDQTQEEARAQAEAEAEAEAQAQAQADVQAAQTANQEVTASEL